MSRPNLPNSMGAGGACAKHGVYDGHRCPACVPIPRSEREIAAEAIQGFMGALERGENDDRWTFDLPRRAVDTARVETLAAFSTQQTPEER